ncbi:AraC family transcriptional regulator [Variovorax sp. M-6]|uniref:AraC family transcriptional regulator n=1 Tax=Variovorax sp. M-6 TaxID=3233041 RepID=UPI003F94CFB8
MATSSHLIRSAGLAGYAEVARFAGLDPHAMLRNAGLPRRCLDQPDALISMEAACKLLDQSAAATGMEDFGLRMAATRRISNLGPVLLVMRQERTALGALRTLLNYNRLLNDALQAHIEQDQDLVLIREELVVNSSVPTRQSMELTVGVMVQVLKELLGTAWQPRSICFTHRKPRDASFYRAYLGRNVDFNADFNGIVCSAVDLQRELPAAEPALAGFARRALDAELSARRAGGSTAVQHLIAAMLGNGRCTVDKVAQHLGVSRATLHRQLAAEGETFSSLLESVRRDVALRLQSESDRPLDDVAAMLGFSSASAFAHWYRAAFATSFARSRREMHTRRVRR